MCNKIPLIYHLSLIVDPLYSLYIFFHLIFTKNFPFADEKTEVEKDIITCTNHTPISSS